MRKSAQTVIRPDAYYTIAAANGRVLEVADFNTENGASVRLWSYEGQPWQQWQFVEAGDGEYRIRNRFTGKVMDLAMSGVCNGTWVHQWTQTAGAGQRWQIVEAGGGKVKLRNVLADKVIDLVGMRVENGTQAQIWQDVFGENQLWKLDPVPARLLARPQEEPVKISKPSPAGEGARGPARGRMRGGPPAGQPQTGKNGELAPHQSPPVTASPTGKPFFGLRG